MSEDATMTIETLENAALRDYADACTAVATAKAEKLRASLALDQAMHHMRACESALRSGESGGER